MARSAPNAGRADEKYRTVIVKIANKRTTFLLLFGPFMVSAFQEGALGKEPNWQELPWKEQRSRESGGSRNGYCNQPVSFQLLPRGANGDLQWEVLTLEGTQKFRITVALPYSGEPPIFDEVIEVSATGLQQHALPKELDDKRYRYTVQVECNPSDPSHNVVATGFIHNTSLISNERSTVTIPGT